MVRPAASENDHGCSAALNPGIAGAPSASSRSTSMPIEGARSIDIIAATTVVPFHPAGWGGGSARTAVAMNDFVLFDDVFGRIVRAVEQWGPILWPNDDRPEELRITCTNLECDFNGDRPLPVPAVDEPIYRRLPAFLIATVDKFASLPWEARTGVLLGGADRHDKSGFHGAAEPRAGTRLERPLLPPDLVIQDELHLISGPLGTMVGLYESVIDALCVRAAGDRSVRPKIVASTATARQAGDQPRHTRSTSRPPAAWGATLGVPAWW